MVKIGSNPAKLVEVSQNMIRHRSNPAKCVVEAGPTLVEIDPTPDAPDLKLLLWPLPGQLLGRRLRLLLRLLPRLLYLRLRGWPSLRLDLLLRVNVRKMLWRVVRIHRLQTRRLRAGPPSALPGAHSAPPEQGQERDSAKCEAEAA